MRACMMNGLCSCARGGLHIGLYCDALVRLRYFWARLPHQLTPQAQGLWLGHIWIKKIVHMAIVACPVSPQNASVRLIACWASLPALASLGWPALAA